MNNKKKYNLSINSAALMLVCALGLPACSPTMDMQGSDPVDYYAQHPIKNKIEVQNVSQLLHFESAEDRLDNDEVDKLKQALHDVSPMAAEGVIIQVAKADAGNTVHRRNLIALLRSMGYDKNKISFEPSPDLSRNDVKVDVRFAAVIQPDCPDWRRSPVTTYSNTTQGNIGCATEVNLGAMVADPHDLLRGTSYTGPDSARSARVVDQYHGGQAGSSAAAAPAASGSAGASSASAALPSGGGQ